MNPSKQHFLFLLLITFIVRSQVLNPIGNCLGNCVNCASSDLSACKGGLSCEWGYYIDSPNGTCTLAPSKELIWSQLGQRTAKNVPPVSESWGDSTKQIACEYNSPSGKKYIDALGLFGGVTMLQKTFTVNSNSQLFQLSFNLLRDEWMPFNDFLLVDISSKDETLQSIEISYEQRIKVETQQTAILCGNKRVISEKFNVKIHNNNDIGSTLTIIFTSFLYTSHWALSNVKLLSACTHFSSYNQNTQTCTICDTDSYLATLYDGEKRCDKCPSLCKTCISKINCTSCFDGATMNKNGTCTFAQTFKTQQITSIHSNLSICGNYSFYLSNSVKKVTFSDIKNQNNQLYDQLQIHFKLYYNPYDWTTSSTDKISIKINKIEVFILTYKNFTNKGTISCKTFKSNYTAVIQVLTPKKIQNDNSLSLEVEYIGKNKEVQFGISEVFVKSMKKEAPTVYIPKAIIQNNTVNIGLKAPVNASTNLNVLNGSNTTSKSQSILNTPSNSNVTNNATLPNNQNSINNNNTSNTENLTVTTPSIVAQKQITFNKTQNSSEEQIKANDTIDIGESKKLKPPPKSSIMTINLQDSTINSLKTVKPQISDETVNTTQIDSSPIIVPYPSSPSISQKSQQTNSQLLPSIPQNANITPQNNASQSNLPQIQPQKDLSSNQQAPISSKVAYIPTSNSDHSGLHVVISHVPLMVDYSLKVSIDKLDPTKYSISDTYIQDSDLHLFIAIASSFINGKMTVYKVEQARLLQTTSNPQSAILAVVEIDRYDSLSSSQLFSINAFSVIFQVFAWVGVVAIIIAILSGYGIVMQEYITSLQLLFLHVYIAVDYLPLTFRDVIGGLSCLQNLNFLFPSHGASIQKSWLGNVIQNGPIRFFLFNTDINFTREFYPIIIINIAYAIWFMGLFLSKRFFLRKDLIDEEKPALYRILDNIVCRPINYLDQIWRYQFLATVWCCFIQFYNLTYPEGSNRSEVLNALLCILAFVCSLGWPVFLGYYSRKYYYENQYSDYLYRFEDVYFCRIPEYFLPSNHHRIGYPIVRSAKLFLAAAIIAYCGNIASLTLLLLVGFHLFEVGYAKYHQIFSDHKYFAHRLIQNVLFALLELILFFLCNFSSLALTESYVYIGFVLSGMALVIVLNSLARVVHLAYQKYRQMFEEINWQIDQIQKPKTERVV